MERSRSRLSFYDVTFSKIYSDGKVKAIGTKKPSAKPGNRVPRA
jgi:hypothetical protein